jgi:hypothetical protein
MDPKLPEDFQSVSDSLPDDSSPQNSSTQGANASDPEAGMDEAFDAPSTESMNGEDIGLSSEGEPDADWEEFSGEDTQDSEEPSSEAAAPPTAETASESSEETAPENKQTESALWYERLLDLLQAEVKVQDSTGKLVEPGQSIDSGQSEEAETSTDIIHGPIDNPGQQAPLRQPSGTIELPLPAEGENNANASSESDAKEPNDTRIGSETVTIVQGQNSSEIGHPLPRIYVAVELLNARQLYEQARHDTAQLLQTTLVNIADDRINFWFWKRRSSERASDRFGR